VNTLPGNRIRTIALLFSIAVILQLMGACTDVPEEGLRLLRDGNAQYQTGQHEEAIRSTTTFIERYGKSPAAAEAHYVRGMARLAKGQRDEAGKDFYATIERSKRQELTARAKAELGNMAFDDRDFAGAADWFKDSLPQLPKQAPYDEMAYRLGVAYQRTGRWDQARKTFAAILDEYAGQPVEALARRQVAWNHDFFAIQCGAYRQAANADAQVAKLRAAGIHARTVPDTWDNQPLFVVLVGQYDNYSKALKELPRVKQIAGDAIVRP
jgi:outer membrane protein assembly factor BamD (BamD/ComL family)